MSKQVVAIVGRPNVGKSVLFNKLAGRRKAITKDEPGVTRDLNYADVTEGGKTFTLVDTGGFEPDPAGDVIAEKVKEQTRLAIEEADIVVLVMDLRDGPHPIDKEMVDMLRRSEKPVIWCVNKVDTPRLEADAAEFYDLGIDKVMPVSAEHSLGIIELAEEIVTFIPDPPGGEELELDVTRVAIVGRPNVGKSSLLNRLTGSERAIVSEVAGTTRDSVDMPYELGGRRYMFIDTAGIRKKTRISRKVEIYSAMEAIKTIDRSDVALLVIDAGAGIVVQDEKIGAIIEDKGKGCVVVVNKWDLVEKETNTMRDFTGEVHLQLPGLSFAPVIFTSALTGSRIDKVMDVVDEVRAEGERAFTTSSLNDALKEATRAHPAPIYRGRPVKFYYMTQTGTSPVTFLVFVNNPKAVGESYRRYLVNRFREKLDFKRAPLIINFRRRR